MCEHILKRLLISGLFVFEFHIFCSVLKSLHGGDVQDKYLVGFSFYTGHICSHSAKENISLSRLVANPDFYKQ